MGFNLGEGPGLRTFVRELCVTPKQYANLVTIAGNGALTIYDHLSGTWTNYGVVTKPDGSPLGSYSMDVLNDATNPRIIIQSGGKLYSLAIDPDTCEPIGTQAVEIGPHNNPQFGGNYPVGTFAPGTTKFYVALGSGSRLGVADIDTGEVTTLGVLKDTRDGANAAMGFGDAFHDPNGKMFGFARDIRGATFGATTGTILWEIDPVALTAKPVGLTAAPSSGTGAAWAAPGVYALSTSNGTIYYYRPALDTAPGSTAAWTTEIPASPAGVNDLGNLWKTPDTIRLLHCVTKDKDDQVVEEGFFQTVQQPDGSFETLPYTSTIPVDVGKCEPDANPFTSDPFGSGGSGAEPKPVEKVWRAGCYDSGVVLWREDCDGFFEYRYGEPPVTSPTPPPGFKPYECGDTRSLTDTQPFCEYDADPQSGGQPVQTVYRQQDNTTGTVIWFDGAGQIPEPPFKEAGECPNTDPNTLISEEVVCIGDTTFIRRRVDYLQDVGDGLARSVRVRDHHLRNQRHYVPVRDHSGCGRRRSAGT